MRSQTWKPSSSEVWALHHTLSHRFCWSIEGCNPGRAVGQVVWLVWLYPDSRCGTGQVPIIGWLQILVVIALSELWRYETLGLSFEEFKDIPKLAVVIEMWHLHMSLKDKHGYVSYRGLRLLFFIFASVRFSNPGWLQTERWIYETLRRCLFQVCQLIVEDQIIDYPASNLCINLQGTLSPNIVWESSGRSGIVENTVFTAVTPQESSCPEFISKSATLVIWAKQRNRFEMFWVYLCICHQ